MPPAIIHVRVACARSPLLLLLYSYMLLGTHQLSLKAFEDALKFMKVCQCSSVRIAYMIMLSVSG